MAGAIRGKSVDAATPSMTGPEQMFGSGTSPSVAGTPSGFVVAWQSGNDLMVPRSMPWVLAAPIKKVNDATHMDGPQTQGRRLARRQRRGRLTPGIFVQCYGPGTAIWGRRFPIPTK